MNRHSFTKVIMTGLVTGLLVGTVVQVPLFTAKVQAAETCGREITDQEGNQLFVEGPHKVIKIEATEPTAEKDGSKEYWQCTICKKYFETENGNVEIEEGSWVVPLVEKEVEVELGQKLAIGQIVNKTGAFEKMTLANASKYESYFTVDSTTGTITTKKNYKKKIASTIPVTVTASGKDYTVNVKVKIPDPVVNVKRKLVTINGKQVYKYVFQYNIKGASKIKVRLDNSKSASIRKELDRKVSKPKSDKSCYIMFSKKAVEEFQYNMTFSVTAYYGKNQSETVAVEE